MLIWWRFFELKMRKNMNLLLLFFVLLKKILSYYHEFPLFLNARIRSHFNYLARFVLFLLSGQHFSGKCIFSEIESGLKFPYFHNKKFYMYNYLWMVYHLDFLVKANGNYQVSYKFVRKEIYFIPRIVREYFS